MNDESKTVALVVDDVMPNRKLLNSLLSRLGFTVIEADSGERSIELFQQQPIDIVFMDVMMPGIDGYEATRQIKQLQGDRFVPVILVTALDESQGMATGIDSGADDYLTKPIDAVFLKTKVRAMERIRRLHEQLFRNNQQLVSMQRRIDSEQKMAEGIMNTAISQRKDEIPGLTSTVEPADIFSGDLVLQAFTPAGWMVLVCDFTGHGLPAAVGTVPVTETFYTMAGKGLSAEAILSELNYKLKNFLPTNMFMGCVLLDWQQDVRQLRIWNGGMPRVLHKDAGDGICQHYESTDLPLGIIDKQENDFALSKLQLSNGDALVVYSDGLIEAENRQAEQFGLARLEQQVETAPAGDLESRILQQWREFQGDAEQLDDVTLVTLMLAS